jgi:hypothetical protein
LGTFASIGAFWVDSRAAQAPATAAAMAPAAEVAAAVAEAMSARARKPLSASPSAPGYVQSHPCCSGTTV